MGTDVDWGARAQEAAEKHVGACYNAMEVMDEDPGAEVENPACAPFCACPTCDVRETLYAAYPYLAIAALVDAMDTLQDPEYRKKVKDDDPNGILALIGAEVFLGRLLNEKIAQVSD